MRKLIIFYIYRAPIGNLNHFYDSLEIILHHFLQPHVAYLIFGDLNINLLKTKGNKISCAEKRELYSEYINKKDDIQTSNYYREYCKVLRRVINEAKKKTILPQQSIDLLK
jgi:hypothetical protein